MEGLKLFTVLGKQFDTSGPAVLEPALQNVGQHLAAFLAAGFFQQIAHQDVRESDLQGGCVVDEQAALALFAGLLDELGGRCF